MFFIEAGTLHAIGKGILIAEIQQNSNTTYRIYDYGRMGKDGKPRELHVEKAKDVTALRPAKQYPETPAEKHEGYTSRLLASCEYFTVSVLDIDGGAELSADSSSFNSLLILEGEGTAGDVGFKKGDSIFITAGTGSYTVSGKCKAVLTKV